MAAVIMHAVSASLSLPFSCFFCSICMTLSLCLVNPWSPRWASGLHVCLTYSTGVGGMATKTTIMLAAGQPQRGIMNYNVVRTRTKICGVGKPNCSCLMCLLRVICKPGVCCMFCGNGSGFMCVSDAGLLDETAHGRCG